MALQQISEIFFVMISWPWMSAHFARLISQKPVRLGSDGASQDDMVHWRSSVVTVEVAVADFRQGPGNFWDSKRQAERKFGLAYINSKKYAYGLSRKCFKDELEGLELEIIRKSCDFWWFLMIFGRFGSLRGPLTVVSGHRWGRIGWLPSRFEEFLGLKTSNWKETWTRLHQL